LGRTNHFNYLPIPTTGLTARLSAGRFRETTSGIVRHRNFLLYMRYGGQGIENLVQYRSPQKVLNLVGSKRRIARRQSVYMHYSSSYSYIFQYCRVRVYFYVSLAYILHLLDSCGFS
jgi:hypothetical protein